MARRRRPEEFSVVDAFDGLRADYKAGKDTRFQSRLRGVDPAGSGADYHYASDMEFVRIRERARDYVRNNCLIGQGFRRLAANVIQDGFTLDIDTGDKNLDRELRGRWQAWSSDPTQCHSEGVLAFPQMERLAFVTALADGDVFTLLLKSGSLQWVEAERVRTPRNTTRNVVHGILLDDMRRRQQVWITRGEVDPRRPVSRVSDVTPYPFRDDERNPVVLQLYEPARLSQTRGVTALAPCSETIGMWDDLEFATLVRAQIASLIAVRRERVETWQPGTSPQWGVRSTETQEGAQGGAYTRPIEGLQVGMEIAGDVGEKLFFDSANIPAATYFEHTARIINYIAVNLDLPPHVLLLDPSKTNFSGWRGAIDQARLRFRQMQQWLVAQFHGPVYRWKVRQWLAMDDALAAMSRASDSVDPFGHRWNAPSWTYIEPLKDASADLLQQRNALNSPRRIQAARGRDWSDVSVEIVDDNFEAMAYAFERAAEFNNRFAAERAAFGWPPLHPRELISLPTPDGVTVNVADQQPQEGQADAAA
jgi:lambda family phage portal protein